MIAAAAVRHLARIHEEHLPLADYVAALDGIASPAVERALATYVTSDRMPTPAELARHARSLDR